MMLSQTLVFDGETHVYCITKIHDDGTRELQIQIYNENEQTSQDISIKSDALVFEPQDASDFYSDVMNEKIRCKHND